MTGTLAHIFRHPIKAHGREALASVLLSAGACLPWDRHWAVTHGRSKFDAAQPGWTPCSQFQRGARTPGLMAIEARFDEAAGVMVLTHPALAPLEFRPETEGTALIEWLTPISPEGDFRPVALVSAPGRGMTDSDFPSISINSLSSLSGLSQHMGVDLSIHRWRGNLWLEGFAPFAEMEWIGREIRVGEALLRVEERIGRCKATTANPKTGEVDADTLAGLRALTGEQGFGVYAVVISPGRIVPGDKIEVL